MTLRTRIARVAAAAALVLAVTVPTEAQELDDLAQHIASQSAALGQVLDRLSRPEIARAVVATALEGDARKFEGLFEGIDVEVPNRCVWIADTVEKLTSTFVGFAEECRLRDDLTLDEWIQYVQITRRHHRFVLAENDGSSPAFEVVGDGHVVIPPGAYLDELKANGLVACSLVKKYSSGIFLFPGKPERFCLGKP
jgi:hypothetical protein